MLFFVSDWNRHNRVELLEHLEMYVSAGLPMSVILSTVSQIFSGRKAGALERVRIAVESGQTLGNSLVADVGLPLVIASVINCGESAGSLAAALRNAHDLLEKENILIGASISASIYPAVIFVATSALSLGLTQGVVPQIAPILFGLHRDLPFLTKIVVNISAWIAVCWPYIIAVFIVLFLLNILFYRFCKPFHFAVHWLCLKMPLLGTVLHYQALSMFFRVTGALVNAGVPVDSAFHQAASVVNLWPLRQILLKQHLCLRQGTAISGITFPGVPAFILSLLVCGQASGQLGVVLIRAADLLDRQLNTSFKRVSVLVEPVMMLCLGGFVGLVALSIMLPIYDISSALER